MGLVGWAQEVGTQDASAPQIEYTYQRNTYEIADITVTGADSYEDFVLIGFSGLAVGDKIDVPGDQITKAIRRFWKQGMFADVKIVATKIEGDKIWLEMRFVQRPRISSVEYEGLKKSEKEDPSILRGSHKRRIASGSGNSVDDVNKMINQFERTKKMMKQFSSMGNMFKF